MFFEDPKGKLVHIKQAGQACAQEFILELSSAPNGQGSELDFEEEEETYNINRGHTRRRKHTAKTLSRGPRPVIILVFRSSACPTYSAP